MPRGRTPREAAMLRRAVSGLFDKTRDRSPAAKPMIEPLENRRYFITLQGGDVYDFIDASDNRIRIQLSGDIVAEFLSLRVYDTNNQAVVIDPVPPLPEDVDAPDNYGADLYNIYVVAAAANASIVITQVNDGGVATPYEGDVGGIQVLGSQTLTPQGGGGVYIGARTKDIDAIDGSTEANLPITYVPNRAAYGFRPSTRGIYAGFETADDVSMDKVFIGGTLTGRFYMGRHLNTLHVNDLLTGDARGVVGNSTSSIPNNVFVGGDLRNLLVTGSAGTAGDDASVADGAPDHATGLDLRIGGKLGNTRVGGSWIGTVEVINNPEVRADSNVQPFQEIEFQTESAGAAYLQGFVSSNVFYNDDEAGMQFGSSHSSSITGLTQSLDFAGEINTSSEDYVDNYALPLIAGQHVVIGLSAFFAANVGVFDPLGRLVATDYADPSGAGVNEQFQFTANLPGTYRIAVAAPGDADFNGVGGEYEPTEVGVVPYTLSISEYGEVAFGGAMIDGSTLLTEQNGGVIVRTGDFGAWHAAGNILAGLFATYNIRKGNLRSMVADNIGNQNVLNPLSPDLFVPRGTVGYIKADQLININPSAVSFDDPVLSSAVGFDYQRVEAGGDMVGNLVARRAIGSIIAAAIPAAPIFYANADDSGQDGTIDLIQVTGDFGTQLTGGPGLFTGLGGNVKYVDVLGEVYRDPYFGTAFNSEITLAPGQSYQLIDDSGATGIVTPTQVITATTTPGGGVGADVEQGQLTLVPYGVRESGGVVLIKVSSTTSVEVVSTNRVGSFDITELTTEGTGSPVIYDEENDIVGYDAPDTTTPPQPGVTVRPVLTPEIRNDIKLTGKAPINVMSIIGSSITDLTNFTTGEIASVDATTVGSLQTESVGYIKSTTAAEVVPETNLPTGTFPFNDHSFGFNITGPVIEILSRQAIGTMNLGEATGRIAANSDGRNVAGMFEGITAPVVGTILQRVDIGEGVAFGGTGEVVRGGVFAVGGTDSYIGQVLGTNADIRGFVGSEGSIRDIALENGSIVASRIATPPAIEDLIFFNQEIIPEDFQTDPADIITDPTDPNFTGDTAYLPDYSLGTIRLSGNGGIMGTDILVGDFNAIDVRGGFGIIGTNIFATAQYNSNVVVASDGLGIRDTTINAGLSLDRLEARGTGSRMNVNIYSPTVLQSASKRKFDAFSGRRLGGGNDLHKYLGTSKTNPSISGVTNSGIIEDVVATGALELGKVEAFVIRDDPNNTIPNTSTLYPMRLAFANTTGTVKARSSILGLQLRTGQLDTLTAGGDFIDTSVAVSGRTKTIAAGRNIKGTSVIEARGPNGSIDTVFARLGIFGSITASRDIGEIVAESLGNQTQTLGAIQELRIGDDVLTGAYVRATKGIGTLFVGGDVQAGATISASSYGETTIVGRNDGSVIVA